MMRIMILLMKNIDIFSVPVQLKYNNDSSFKSIKGFILSLVIYMMMILITIILLKDLFDHSEPRVVQKMGFSVNPQDFNLNKENFQVAIGLYDQYNEFIINKQNEKYYDIKIDFRWVKFEYNGKLNYNQVINEGVIRKCHLDDATYGINPIIMPNLYCLDKKTFENNSLALGGMYTQDHIRTIRVQVLKCINSPECAPYEEVEAKLTGAKVNIGFYDYFLDSTSYETPLNRVINFKQFGLEVDSQSFTKMWMRRITVQTDENFFLLNNKRNIQEALQYKTYETSNNQPLNNSLSMPSMYQFIFGIEQEYESTYRNYENILEVMAYVVGFYRFMTFTVGLFILPLVQQDYKNQIGKDIKKYYDQCEKILQQYSKVKTQQIGSKKIEKSKYFRKFLDPNEILKYMDVTNIIQLSQDMLKLKNILLSKEQRMLFDLIPVQFNSETSQCQNYLGESIKFVQSQNDFININLKRFLFSEPLESEGMLPEYRRINSIIPEELKSQIDLQEYQIIVNRKHTDQYKNSQK